MSRFAYVSTCSMVFLGVIMKMLGRDAILAEGGKRMNIPRNMMACNGKDFKCACGSTHVFSSYMGRMNFVSGRSNAKMLIICPKDSSFSTLVRVKYKCLFIFEKFISLAGNKQ